MEFLLQILAELFSAQEVDMNVQDDSAEELELVDVLESDQNENIFGIMHFH